MSIETEEKLNQIMGEISDDMQTIEGYAGTAYCTEKDESEAKFFKGQYIALKRTRLAIEKHKFDLQITRENIHE